MADEFQEKTEEPTPKKREDARQEGQVARSMEVNSAMVLLAVSLVFFFTGGWLVQNLGAIMREAMLRAPSGEVTPQSIVPLFEESARHVLRLVMPFLIAVGVVGLASNIGQVGWMLSGKTIQPKLDKINPLKGIKNLFSARSLVELLKNLFKVGLIGLICYLVVKHELEGFLPLVYAQPGEILSHIGGTVLKLMGYTLLMLGVIALFDFSFQRWDTTRKLRMSKHEVKEERKQTEGDPQQKGRIRSLQQETAYNRMIADVSQADVVVTNPTRLAVALKYDADKGAAPRVIAKGARLVAARIRELARENGIPVIENREMARTLFKACEVGMEIPASLYRAVAELLAFVYRLRGQGAAS